MPEHPPPARPGRVLTAVEFDVLWEQLGLGPTPAVLRLASPGRTHADRRRIAATGWQGLRARGLAGPSGPDPELARLLRLLAVPAAQLELRAYWGRSVRAVAAGGPGAGVVAVRQDATVTLAPCGSLPSALLATVPPVRPGCGRASTVRTATLAAALAALPGAGLRAELVARHVEPSEAGVLERMLSGADRRAQVVALATDAAGIPRRAGGVLRIADGPRGRYLVVRTTAADGTDWTTVAPTDDRGLRHRLVEMLAVAASGPARVAGRSAAPR